MSHSQSAGVRAAARSHNLQHSDNSFAASQPEVARSRRRRQLCMRRNPQLRALPPDPIVDLYPQKLKVAQTVLHYTYTGVRAIFSKVAEPSSFSENFFDGSLKSCLSLLIWPNSILSTN